MPRVNLVPLEEQRREFRRRFYIIPFAGAALLLIGMGSTYVYFDREVANTQKELQGLKEANAQQAPKVKELEKYEAMQKEKQDRLRAVVEIYSQRVRWSRILDYLAYVIPDQVWLDTLDGEVPELIVSTKKSSSAAPEYDFIIEGHSYDMTTVAMLMSRLTLLDDLTNVVLISAEKEQISGGGGYAIRFRVGADLSDKVAPSKSLVPDGGDQQQEEETTTTGGRTTSTTGATNGSTTARTTGTTATTGTTGGG